MNLLSLSLAFFLAVTLESTILNIPLVLILLLVLFVRNKTPEIFFLAFILGFLLDVLKLQRAGVSSIYFLITLFIIFLYDKKYEINTLRFVVISSGTVSIVHLSLFSNPSVLQIVFSIIIGVISYICIGYINKFKVTKKSSR